MIDSKRESELRDAIELMYFAYRTFTLGPDRILTKRGLNRVHHRILYFVGRNPGLSVNKLLGILQVRKQALNAPLRQLVEMKLVSSEKSQSDGRVRQLRLTPRGNALESRLTATQVAQLDDVFGKVGTDAEDGWRAAMRLLFQDALS